MILFEALTNLSPRLTVSITGCPFVHTIHFKSVDFAWTHASPHDAQLDAFTIPNRPHKTRYRCKTCGTTVTSKNSKANSNSVWGVHLRRHADGTIMSWDSVKPTAHIFYDTRVLDIRDEIPKWDGYEGESTLLS